ncbi:MAG TPA: hypothetical protein VFZ73_14945 [Gemmatimonadaceae bacterium]
MEFLTQLWLPILLSGVASFIISALAWIFSPHHKKDWRGLPDPDSVQAALGAQSLPVGQYALPWGRNAKAFEDPAMKERLDRGPRAFITIVPNGMPATGPMMAKAVVYNVIVSLLAAYVGWHALGPDAQYLEVFRIVGTTSIMAYTLASVPDSIWFGRPWRTFGMQVVDGIAFGLVTAGIFGWLWP